MTVRTQWFPMDGKIGVDLNTPISVDASALPEVPMQPINLGERVQGNNASEWAYVQASATVTAFNVVAIDRNLQARNITTAILASGIYAFGIAEFQTGQTSAGTAPLGVANASQFFYALMKVIGGAKVNVATDGSVAPGSALYVCSTAGRVAPTGGSNERLNGLQAAVTASGTAGEIVGFSYIMPGILISVSDSA